MAARGVGVGSERGGLRAAAPLPRGRAVPRGRRCAPPPPRRAAAPLPAAAPRPPGSHTSRQGSERGCDGAGARSGLGGRTRPRHPPHPPAPLLPLTRVCGAAAASRQSKNTALHFAAFNGHAPCFKSLLEAGADASLKDQVSNGAEGRGGRRGGWVGRGAGRGWVRGLACTGAAPPLSAPPSPRPLPPGRPPPPPPSPLPVAVWQDGIGLRQGDETGLRLLAALTSDQPLTALEAPSRRRAAVRLLESPPTVAAQVSRPAAS